MKTYKTREAIIKDIDSALSKVAKALLKAAEHLDQEELLKGSSEVAQLREHRELADKQFRKVKRLQSVRLPKLKERLAIFDTLPLPGTSTETIAVCVPQIPPDKDASLDDELMSVHPQPLFESH